MSNDEWKIIRRPPLTALRRLRHLAWIVFSVDELFAFGRGTANHDCPGSRRFHRRTGRAGESFEGHLGAIVAGHDMRKSSAHVISSQQFETVTSLSVRGQVGHLRRYRSRLNSAPCATPEL